MSNGVKVKQDEIEDAFEKFTPFFLEEQCWEDVCSCKRGMEKGLIFAIAGGMNIIGHLKSPPNFHGTLMTL
eukprot:9347677-Ditylum_brightwellii.AAC.1